MPVGLCCTGASIEGRGFRYLDHGWLTSFVCKATLRPKLNIPGLFAILFVFIGKKLFNLIGTRRNFTAEGDSCHGFDDNVEVAMTPKPPAMNLTYDKEQGERSIHDSCTSSRWTSSQTNALGKKTGRELTDGAVRKSF
jgi:hypothetical protein